MTELLQVEDLSIAIARVMILSPKLVIADEPVSGCAFHPRCPAASPLCRRERPVMRDRAAGHQACHHPDGAAGTGVGKG